MKKLVTILAITLLVSSCSSKDKDKIIASVNDKELFLSNVTDKIPEQIEDSAYFTEKFINDWIRRELMVSYAEMNLSTDLLKYDEQIKDYRESLLIYAYQQELLNQNFDTVIDLSEIRNYHKQHKDEFILNKNIFRGRFIVVDKSAPNLNKLDGWYKSEEVGAIENLEDYCLQFSKEYSIDVSTWIYFSIFNSKLPEIIENEEYFLKNTKSTFFEDEDFRYYIYIKDYQLKEERSPLEIEREQIRNVLLNKKKIEYLKQLEN
ncbi:MAG: hypothetical protein CMD28_00705, partial [Flavobacteriales bacterium]|nr:hypothetical protein [Flavobacteriales bacterium]